MKWENDSLIHWLSDTGSLVTEGEIWHYGMPRLTLGTVHQPCLFFNKAKSAANVQWISLKYFYIS